MALHISSQADCANLTQAAQRWQSIMMLQYWLSGQQEDTLAGPGRMNTEVVHATVHLLYRGSHQKLVANGIFLACYLLMSA
jgi:hypothetical protein